MRKTHLVTVAAVLMFASAGVAAQNIVGSKHDMTNTSYDNSSNTQQAVCVFCHTPHKAQGNGGPIWNRTAGANSFTMYETTSAGTNAASTPGAESLACLGCHDGTVAVDSIYNAPGSGTWTSDGLKKIASNSFAYVGTDLSDDHPVSIIYTEGRAGLKAANNISGMPLFGASDDQVECATCHSVHDNTEGSFLRVSQTDSAICTACHNR